MFFINKHCYTTNNRLTKLNRVQTAASRGRQDAKRRLKGLGLEDKVSNPLEDTNMDLKDDDYVPNMQIGAKCKSSIKM